MTSSARWGSAALEIIEVVGLSLSAQFLVLTDLVNDLLNRTNRVGVTEARTKALVEERDQLPEEAHVNVAVLSAAAIAFNGFQRIGLVAELEVFRAQLFEPVVG